MAGSLRDAEMALPTVYLLHIPLPHSVVTATTYLLPLRSDGRHSGKRLLKSARIAGIERTTKQAALQSASTRILVADSSKFGVVKSGHYADITDFDIIITDSSIKQEEVDPIRKLGNITLYCV